MSYPHIHVNSKRKKGPKKERVVIIVIVNQVKTAICPVLRTGSTKMLPKPISTGLTREQIERMYRLYQNGDLNKSTGTLPVDIND
jgi:hypothetical protein